MLTYKSDDVVGRTKAFEAIVKGTDIPTPRVPESFKVLVKELQALGLRIDPVEALVKVDEAIAPASDLVNAAEEKVEGEVKEMKEALEAEEVVDEPKSEESGVEVAEPIADNTSSEQPKEEEIV
jgi:DNA-directed RNA polymerase subunit beta